METLFVQNQAEVWGTFDAATREVKINENHEKPNVSLLNMAAIKTFQNGGQVYLVEKDEMPDPQSVINALYRF